MYSNSEFIYAYQPGKSTNLTLNDLNRLLLKFLQDKELAVGTFVDIKGAFNNAQIIFIINALAMKGVPAVVRQWIKASLEVKGY